MRKILLVIDMQNDFIYGSLGTPEAAAIVERVVKLLVQIAKNVFALVYHTVVYGR